MTSIKKLLGITEEYEHFDTDLILHINSVLGILTQLGLGPESGFNILDGNAVWNDFLPPDDPLLVMAKSLMVLRVKLLFDPPASSVVVESMNKQITELEWRIKVACESKS